MFLPCVWVIQRIKYVKKNLFQQFYTNISYPNQIICLVLIIVSVYKHVKILDNEEEATLIVTHFVCEWGKKTVRDTSTASGVRRHTELNYRRPISEDVGRAAATGDTATNAEKLFAKEKLGVLQPRQFIHSTRLAVPPQYSARSCRLILSTPINIDAGFFVLHGGFIPFY